jgi:hypothetical protein
MVNETFPAGKFCRVELAKTAAWAAKRAPQKFPSH